MISPFQWHIISTYSMVEFYMSPSHSDFQNISGSYLGYNYRIYQVSKNPTYFSVKSSLLYKSPYMMSLSVLRARELDYIIYTYNGKILVHFEDGNSLGIPNSIDNEAN